MFWAAAAAFDGACVIIALVALLVMLDAACRGAARIAALRAQRRKPAATVPEPAQRKAIAAFTLSPHVIYLEPAAERHHLPQRRRA